MWIGGHMQVGWFLGWGAGLDRRARTALTWCGALPDLDAATRLAGVDAYLAGHHVYLHNLAAAALLPLLPAAFVRGKLRVYLYLLGLATVGLHLLSDGYGLLELRPLWPFRQTLWWPNDARWSAALLAEIVVPALLIAAAVVLYRKRGASVLEALPERLTSWVRRRYSGGDHSRSRDRG